MMNECLLRAILPRASVRISIVLATALVAVSLGGCPPEVSPGLSGVLERDDWVISAGELQTVDDDVTMRASGVVIIDGDLVVAEDTGQSITIEAEGDVIISGRIVAGK